MNVASVLGRAAIAALLVLGARALPGARADLCAYVLLGILPGLIAADATLPRSRALVRLAVGLAAGPLVAALAGVATIGLGIGVPAAARALVGTSAIAWTLAGALAPRRPAGEAGADEPPGAVWALALGLAVAVALPPLLNPYIAARGDTWTHAGIVLRILDGGLPPEDPRFAAISVRYVWFYNLFVALLCGLRGHPPFGFMIWLNVATAFATVALVAAVALRLWRRREAAVGAAVLAICGMNAAMWLLWPVRLLRAIGGRVRGAEAVAGELHAIRLGEAGVIFRLPAPSAYMTSVLDKLLVGSPLAYAYLLMVLHLWALLVWLEEGRPALLAWTTTAAVGMMLFHGVVGLSVIPVWVGSLALALLLRRRLPWLPPAGRLAAAAAATAAGGLVATPYMISVASGWAPERSGLHHRFIDPDPIMAWTLATACLFVLGFACRPLVAAWRDHRPTAALVRLYLAAMTIFACVVRLPEDNQVKFVYQAFVPAAALAAPAFWSWVVESRRRGAWRAALIALVLLVPVVLTLHGYVADPGRRLDPTMRHAPGEEALERWLREHTPANAIVVDRGFRDLLMVRARRPLYLGTDKGPAWAAFPLTQIVERRRVTADLYGAAADLPGDVAALERLGRPVYVVFRPEDDASTVRGWSAVRREPRFRLVYARDGYRVARLEPRGRGA